MPVDDIFPSGVDDRVAHAHLRSWNRFRHGVRDLLVRDPPPNGAVSSAMLVVASVTWLGIVFPAEVMAVQDSVECHEEVIESHNMVTTRIRTREFMLTCVRWKGHLSTEEPVIWECSRMMTGR